VPPDRLATTTPGRDRTVRQLAYHVFRLSLAYREALRERRLPKEWLDEAAPSDLVDGAAIAAYGAGVQAALAESEPCEGTVDTYYGPQTAHALLERTVWHAAQHVRQLQALLDGMGVAPGARLSAADLEGLPLPDAVW
jgi:hypothetical protein